MISIHSTVSRIPSSLRVEIPAQVMQLLVMDAELYGNPGVAAPDERLGLAAAAVDNLMSSHILPMVPHLLRDEDPMPLYALKVSLPGGLHRAGRILGGLGIAFSKGRPGCAVHLVHAAICYFVFKVWIAVGWDCTVG